MIDRDGHGLWWCLGGRGVWHLLVASRDHWCLTACGIYGTCGGRHAKHAGHADDPVRRKFRACLKRLRSEIARIGLKALVEDVADIEQKRTRR